MEIFFFAGDQRWHHVKHDHLASCHTHGVSLQKVSNFQPQRIVYLFLERSIPSGKKRSRFDKVFNEQQQKFDGGIEKDHDLFAGNRRGF